MFSKKLQPSKKSEDIKKSAAKVLDAKKDTPTRAKHLRLFLDNADAHEILLFFENHYSHVFFIVYDAFIGAEINLRQKGAHKAQREELEAVLYLLEKVLLFLPEHLGRKWQYHAMGRLMSKLLHPGNSWKLIKREAMRLFLLWYQVLGDVAGEHLHAMFATLVPGFPSPYQGLGLTALAAMTPDIQDGPINPAEICPLIPPQSGERWKSPETDLTRIFLDVLLELMVTQVPLIEWKEDVKDDRQRQCFDFLFERFKMYYMVHIFPEFNWHFSLYRPSLELPEVRHFRPAFVDNGDGTKKMDPMLACRVVVIKWIAQYTHLTRNNNNLVSTQQLDQLSSEEEAMIGSQHPRTLVEGNLVRDILYGSRENVNFVHEVYRQSFLLSFSHSPAIKKVISVYKDWIQMNVSELPPFLLEPPPSSIEREREELLQAMAGKISDSLDSTSYLYKDQLSVRAGLQNVLQIFVTNAANVFLLEVSPEYPILLEEQVEMCKRVLNIYRYMVMNVKMEARTWEQLLFILLQITQLTLPESPPRKREDSLGGRLAQAIFQTLIVTWIKANLYVVVSSELWDQFLEVLSSLTMWEELVREWAKTMETLTRVLARQVYNLDLNDLPLDRLSERAQKKKMGKERGTTSSELKSSSNIANFCTSPQPPSASTEASIRSHSSQQHQRHSSPFMMNSRQRSTSESEQPQPPPRTKNAKNKAKKSEMIKVNRSLSESNIMSNLRYGRVEEDLEIDFVPIRKRSKSADSEYRLKNYSDSERSSSPTASSGLECVSMKDSPMMQLDNDTMSEAGSLVSDMFDSHHRSISASNSATSKSVMSGGSVKGWLPDVAVVLWRRMLGALGNINAIGDPLIHAQIYKHLIELFEVLVKIRNNQGVSLDNASTPKPPEYVPPFTIFAPWCFRALQLPEDTFQRGRLYALRLLCLCTVRLHDSQIAKTHLVQFYKVLHTGLTDTVHMDEMYTLIRFTGPRFFSLMLPGYTAYILDFLYAANCIISNSELKGVPRTEATSIVGSLLAFPPLLQNIPLLLPNASELSLISSTDVKDQIVGVLLKSGKKEPAGLARCISLSSLGLFVYNELLNGSLHGKIKEAIQVLLTALRFNNKAVAQIASDMVLLLSDHVEKLLDFYPEVPKKIVEVLARTLTSLMPQITHDLENDERRLLLSLLFCLGEWVMKLPKFMLTHPQEDGKPLLFHVFASLYAASGTNQFKPKSEKVGPAVMINDFDPNMQFSGENNHNQENHDSILDEAEIKSPVRLAAQSLISHFINHLFHFPMETGASSLNSMVCEQDDNGLSEDLTLEALQSPNVQLFVLNDATLVSFVELPILDSVAGFKTSTNQVRMILRDISGKFCWESTALYNTEDSTLSNEDGVIDLPEWPLPVKVLHKRPQTALSAKQALRHRSPSILPNFQDTSDDLDNLDDLLQYIGHSSPECLSEPGRPLNAIISASHFLDPVMEKEMIAGVLGQRTLEQEHISNLQETPISASMRPPSANVSCENAAVFQQSRRLFSQLGLFLWEKRAKIHLVKKTDRLLRELKNLDNKRCREAHKIAVIYVGEGQEDKQSILSNSCGSSPFEEFVAGLGWEVELETHTGFMGGLSKSKTTGETSCYFATSFVEVMFHVATGMPSNSEEALITKTRHLGNDEVHVVWSEHWRDYRRGILPTEFCDVLIIIYPLKNNLFRIQVTRKPNVPYFGPLFNEVIIDKKSLPGLVRATAINASRAKRSMLPHFQSHYEERFYALDQIIKNHKDKSTFEDFSSAVFSPHPLHNLFHSNSRPNSVIEEELPNISRTSTLTISSSQHENTEDQSHSPKNLKKLTAAIRANINNNVARVNRPLSTIRTDEGGLLMPNNNSNNQSPPSAGKKR